MYLLNLNKKGDVYKDDDGITGVPEFMTILKAEKLGPTALKWVALVCDYESPYRHYGLEERKLYQKIYMTHIDGRGLKNLLC